MPNVSWTRRFTLHTVGPGRAGSPGHHLRPGSPDRREQAESMRVLHVNKFLYRRGGAEDTCSTSRTCNGQPVTPSPTSA
ncbi:hypothetical protein NKG94_14890 [Micromonospora sp. M12]